jgi:hypothetical protein
MVLSFLFAASLRFGLGLSGTRRSMPRRRSNRDGKNETLHQTQRRPEEDPTDVAPDAAPARAIPLCCRELTTAGGSWRAVSV